MHNRQMTVYTTIEALTTHLAELRRQQKSIGFVPTMGALHDGHISLVNRSIQDNDFTLVSIFVNPSQFNDPADLEKYPRTPEEDLKKLRENVVDMVFMPAVSEIYPETDKRKFDMEGLDLEGLDLVMEGATRKDHFNGVVRVVSKLFLICEPDRAYFGQKDFQQLVIIKHMVDKLDMPVEIIACPIIRESDGLAMSSRNIRLGPSERKEAPFIYWILQEARLKKGKMSPQQIKAWVRQSFEKQKLMELVYFEIVEDKELKSVESWEEDLDIVACLAVILGGVRLIDNMIFD